jgi:tetratricopeptide (TPR) repeat protein/transcriptional regulator with XRE-family HTH domain
MHEVVDASFGARLRAERQRRGWSQSRLAELVGTIPNTISRWELGQAHPHPHLRARLVALLGLDLVGRDGVAPAVPTQSAFQLVSPGQDGKSAADIARQALWHLPFLRNPFFTGREELLNRLHQRLGSGVPQALTGLGGIGKTHMAIEYAYRHRSAYQVVFWLRAETRELLVSDLALLAEELRLADQGTRDQQRLLGVVQHWLRHNSGWLLVLDNVEDLTILPDLFLDVAGGALLLTTRSSITGTLAQAIELDELDSEEGALFLLRRAKRLGPDATLLAAGEVERTEAQQLVALVGGLPLALDQAGAYLEETACDVSEYLTHYQTQRAFLLSRRGGINPDHPASVSATLALAVAQVEATHPEAAALLQLCAFLQPDAIPEDLLVAGKAELSPFLAELVSQPLALNAAVTTLRQAALLQRQPEEHTFSLHRLVQAVLRDRLDETVQRAYAEQVIRMVNRAFPDSGEEVTWPQCQRYLAQAQACARLIEQWHLLSLEGAQLLTKCGSFLFEQASYKEAEQYLLQAQTISLKTVGEQHPQTATCWNELTVLYLYWGQYAQAEQFAQRALVLQERLFGPIHPKVAMSLNALGGLYYTQGRFAEAEPCFLRSLSVQERLPEPSLPHMADLLHNLAALYGKQGRNELVGPLLERALSLREQSLGGNHLLTAHSLSALANLYRGQGNYEQAEALHQRALRIREEQVGTEHAFIAASLNDLALLAQDQGEYERAESLYYRALTLRQKTLGVTHPRTLDTLQHLGQLLWEKGQDKQALAVSQEALALREQALGPAHPLVADSLAILACFFQSQGKEQEAEAFFHRAQTIWEQALGGESVQMMDKWKRYTQRLCERRSVTQRRGKAARASLEHQATLLSQREQEVLALLAAGNSNREIAEALVVEVGTVKWHLKNIYSKLQVRTRTQAIRRASVLSRAASD